MSAQELAAKTICVPVLVFRCS